MKRVCIIGLTGDGKSGLCNTLCGDYAKKKFQESEKTDSCTNKTIVQKVKWINSNEEFYLADTPGLGDSENRDSLHIGEMIKTLKEVDKINAFILVLNSENPRLNNQSKGMFSIFNEFFGD